MRRTKKYGQRGSPRNTRLVGGVCGIQPLMATKRLYWMRLDVSCTAFTLKRVVESMGYGVYILPVYADFTSRGRDPDLRLERPDGNRYETDHVHVLEVHESLTDFPLLIGGSVHDVSLGSGCKPQTTEDSKVMWTYSHGVKIPVEPLGDLVRKLAASYRDTVLRPSQGGDLHPRLAGDSTNGLVVIDHHLTRVVRWVPRELESTSALIQGRNYENRHTKNLQEMALVAFSNIRSSRPWRPVNSLRNASPIFMPGTPFTVKDIGSDRLKSHSLLP